MTTVTSQDTFTIRRSVQKALSKDDLKEYLKWQITTGTSGPQPISVPNVVGMTQANATSAITTAGLVVGTVTTATSSTVASGSVISQTPASGTSVNSGSAVNLVVSSGPAQVSVPNVVGMTQANATSAITTAGLVVGTVTTATSSTVASGSVISQTPTSGTSVNSGSAVSLVVSSGLPPAQADEVTYTYDALHRLTRATYTNGTVIDYSYDASGNRTSSTVNVLLP